MSLRRRIFAAIYDGQMRRAEKAGLTDMRKAPRLPSLLVWVTRHLISESSNGSASRSNRVSVSRFGLASWVAMVLTPDGMALNRAPGYNVADLPLTDIDTQAIQLIDFPYGSERYSHRNRCRDPEAGTGPGITVGKRKARSDGKESR